MYTHSTFDNNTDFQLEEEKQRKLEEEQRRQEEERKRLAAQAKKRKERCISLSFVNRGVLNCHI